MADPVALAALALDAAIGWPAWLYARIGHPIGGFARAIDGLERRWNRPDIAAARRRALGVIAMVVLIGGTIALCVVVDRVAAALLGRWGWVGSAVLAWPALAQRSLYAHVREVRTALDGDDLPAARIAVGRIVGRDTGRLDAAGVTRAAIESLAESLCDGVVAPLFWLVVGGLPGVWAYKAINTADSLIGHKEARWRAFGWAAARIDDAANLAPARIAGVLLCVAGAGGWRTMARDHGRHASPNAGWPEAAMAGALGVALAGPAVYDGVALDKPWICGDGERAPGGADVRRALRVYLRACLLLWATAAVLAAVS